TNIEDISGGVLGGTLKKGTLKVGDEIEILPGLIIEEHGTVNVKPVRTFIADIVAGKNHLREASPSGSLAISTKLDPLLTKGDNLGGNILGIIGKLPPVVRELRFKVKLFENIVGLEEEVKVDALKMNEILLLSVNTAVTVGAVTEIKGDRIKMNLRIPACPLKGTEIGIARNIKGRWRLIGYGVVE
ncbi:MAG: translation initiation factor IF-2 subunit gamma, partial [Nanoarchaeota archaeon]